MKQRRSIESLFRDNQHKFSEQPRPDAWQRLEGRLDELRPKNRLTISMRWLAIAAGITVLAVAVGVLARINSDKNTYQALLDATPHTIEKLDAADASSKAVEALALVQYYKAKKMYLPIPPAD